MALGGKATFLFEFLFNGFYLNFFVVVFGVFFFFFLVNWFFGHAKLEKKISYLPSV